MFGAIKKMLKHHDGCDWYYNKPCDCGLEVAVKQLENFEKFVKLVADTRTAQKNYFKGRLPGDLRTSKLYESDLDKLLARLAESEKKPADGVQKALL